MSYERKEVIHIASVKITVSVPTELWLLARMINPQRLPSEVVQIALREYLQHHINEIDREKAFDQLLKGTLDVSDT